jgi:hypothetical protein
MTIDRRTARALCTAPELELVHASFAADAGTPSKTRLKAKMVRTRALRDKYRDLFRRQRLAARARTGSKLGAGPGDNARTRQKAQLFAQTLARFEQQWRVLEAAERKAAAAKQRAARRQRVAPARPPAPRARRAPVVPKTGFVTARAAWASRQQRLQNTRAKAIAAHMRSRGRRAQARRDARSK